MNKIHEDYVCQVGGLAASSRRPSDPAAWWRQVGGLAAYRPSGLAASSWRPSGLAA